ncbi:MAG: transposase [Candidatus Thermoplasmatota archaeon]|nr:transposase [Candidatus Thermoplasmatota archaeon]
MNRVENCSKFSRGRSCTTIGEDENVLRKDRFENRFDELEKYLRNFSSEDSFVMESTGFYEPLYDCIESKGFKVKLANPLKIKLIAESRMKNDDVDSEISAKLLKNNWIPGSYVPNKEIRDLRRIVRTRIEIKESMTSYKNRIKFETMRMHTDYDGDAFTLEGKESLRNLKSPRIDSYLNVLNRLTEEVKKIDRELKRHEDIPGVMKEVFLPYSITCGVRVRERLPIASMSFELDIRVSSLRTDTVPTEGRIVECYWPYISRNHRRGDKMMIAIDVHKRKEVVCETNDDGNILKEYSFENSAEE